MTRAILTIMLLLAGGIGNCQESTFEKIDLLLQNYNTPDAPGLSIGITKNDKLIYSRGIGFALLKSGVPNSDATVFEVASVAKQFTAACIWVLIQEKQISLEDDIRKYLPEMPNYGTPIRIKHLLNHTSGIRNYHTVMALQGFDYDKEFYNNQSILQLAAMQKSLNNIPGEKVLYSNTNYNLLAIIIERISKKNLNEFCHENIFLPLGMTSAFFRITSAQNMRYGSTGYRLQNGSYSTNAALHNSYGAGSMGASIQDLSKWIAVLNGNNRRFRSLTRFLTTCETLPNGEKAKYGRGVMADVYKGYKTISHSGYAWGGQAQIISVPEKQLGVIILTNLESINPIPLSYQVLDRFLPDKTKKLPDVAVLYNKPEIEYLKTITGQYKEVNSDMKMDLFVEHDTLKAKGAMAKKGIALMGSGKNKFRRINNQSIEYDFTKDINFDMQISFGGTPFYFKKANFISPESVNTEDFTGVFYSDELHVPYCFYVRDNTLYLSYRNNENIPLSTVQKDEFGNNQRTLYYFKRNENNEVVSMLLSSEGSVKDILFSKK